jgi:tetratricopeptide (TPR) repeat protein
MSEDDNQVMKATMEKATEAAWEKANMEIAAREEAEWKNETLMKAALEAGRAVYHSDLHYNLGVDLFHVLCASLDSNEGYWDGAIAEFQEAVRLDSNNALARNYLRLLLSYRDHPARPEEGKLFPGHQPGTPEFEELSGLVPVDGLPVWPAAEKNIRKVYREQSGREPTEQELNEIKQRVTGVPSQRDLLSAALEAGKQAYEEAVAGSGPINKASM